MTTGIQRHIATAVTGIRDRLDLIAHETGQPLAVIEHLAALRGEIAALEALAVRHARARDSSWSQIAKSFGMTRQGAHQHWAS